eukprot:CCRYP_000208-RA/>CCRYP_000208-RA protein AED:0.17 eAED:0.17 QI:259/1/1/1/1/0.83/6/2103/812
MGQTFCKCCENGVEEPSKSNAVTWGEVTDQFFTDATSLQNSPSSIADPKRSKRIKNKKRNVALHAEFRDRDKDADPNYDMGILAPPLCCETIMEATDNVFAGQDLGVDTLHNGSYGALGSSLTIVSVSDSSNEKGETITGSFLHEPADAHLHKRHDEHHLLIKHEKTPEENAFLDEALSDEDNIVFEMVPEHLRQRLKDYLERVSVPKNTLLIKRGDEPDYLYLILEGEVAVYIDPDEYIDENAVEIGKHAPIDISLGSKRTSSSSSALGTTKREFKQSYVLNLRKSLFGSTFNEGKSPGTQSILGKVFNLAQGFSDSRMSDVSKNTSLGVLLEDASSSANEDEEASFNLYKDLKGLKHERDLGPQDVFGELALIYNCPRTASCVTSTPCVLYRIDGEAFRRILSSSNADRSQKRYTESKAAIESLYNLGVVDELDERTLKDFGNALSPVVFKKGDLVITKGQFNDLMIFVMSGKLLVHDSGVGDSRKENITLNEGGHFGEAELLFGYPSYANVTVFTPKARLMVISKKDYRRRRNTLEPILRRLWCRNTLLQIPVIARSKLLAHEINGLVDKMEPVSFQRGTITPTNEMKAAIFVVISGKIQLSITDDGDGVVHSFGPSDHWGDRALVDSNFYEHQKTRLKAVFASDCMMLTKSAIISVIGSLKRLGDPLAPEARKLKKNMKPSEFHFHRIIGIGMFGKVWLVQHKISRDVYALKVMEKKVIVDRKMTKGVIREKNVMISVEHPFIVDLVATFQDERKLYMLESYIQGGELFGLIYNISKKGYLSNDAAAFYGACLVEAISHLHSRNICHR